MSPLNSESIYVNSGNRSILQFLDDGDRRILDVGCGAGSNGRLIKEVYPLTHITGITCSQAEYEEASKYIDACICADLEKDKLSFLEDFDVLLFCHVLEHLVDPVFTIQRLLSYLKKGGKVMILLPNIVVWRERYKLALGKFEYTEGGIMDRTHLKFYTFYSAPQYLIDPIPELSLKVHKVNGSVPLAFFRHYLLPSGWKQRMDRWGCEIAPNFFGGEIIMVATNNS